LCCRAQGLATDLTSNILARRESLSPIPMLVIMFVLTLMFPVFFPASAILPPVVTVIFPAVRNPPVAGTWCFPSTGDPFMPGACPVPETIDPDVPDYRRRSDVLNARRRRSHHDTVPIVRATCGGDHTGTQCAGGYQADDNKGFFHWFFFQSFGKRITSVRGISRHIGHAFTNCFESDRIGGRCRRAVRDVPIRLAEDNKLAYPAWPVARVVMSSKTGF